RSASAALAPARLAPTITNVRSLTAGQLLQARMFFGAGGTSAQVLTHAGDGRIRIPARQLVLHVDVEQLKALLAGELGTGRAEQAGQQPLSLSARITHLRLQSHYA